VAEAALKIYADISVSRDGFVAGPDPSLDEPLGKGGEQVHDWAFRLAAWRQAHGLEGGEDGPEARWLEEMAAANGAVVMGRKMFSGGSGPWADDPNANGWWGDDPPFHVPVFVVTHHAREPLELDGGTTFHFVTGGFAAAVDRAREAAAGRDVQISGGASVVQQALALELLDELQLHTAPIELGGGTPLFDDTAPPRLQELERIETPHAEHVRYRVMRR
jgi:dihydrofolate reductase